MPIARWPAVLIALTAMAIAGCSAPGIHVPTWAGGLPPGTPPPAAVQRASPSVYDTPPERPAKLMSGPEQARTQTDLAAVRARINAQADALQKKKGGTDR